MNAKIKARWLKALRSGKYKQGHGQLKDGDSFCCLGVLTDLYIKSHRKSWAEIEGRYFLPSVVCEWAGLRTKNPTAGRLTLADHNDGNGTGGSRKPKPFSKIADLIEKYL